MTPPAFDHNKIAPAVPSLQSSDRRPGGSSPGPDAPPIINDQTNDGRWAGETLSRFGARGCDRHTPARSVLTGQGYVYFHNLAGRFGVRSSFRDIRGIGGGCCRPHAINHYAADHSGNDAVKPLKRHFKNSCFTANQPNGGAEHDAGSITQGRGND